MTNWLLFDTCIQLVSCKTKTCILYTLPLQGFSREVLTRICKAPTVVGIEMLKQGWFNTGTICLFLYDKSTHRCLYGTKFASHEASQGLMSKRIIESFTAAVSLRTSISQSRRRASVLTMPFYSMLRSFVSCRRRKSASTHKWMPTTLALPPKNVSATRQFASVTRDHNGRTARDYATVQV